MNRFKSTYRTGIIAWTAVLALFIVTTSCSTKKNTVLSRSYHNLTAHYNAYFNGREAMKVGNKKVNISHIDDFNKILPVFPVTIKQTSQACSAEMETAKKKASKVIKKHSITEKPKRKSGTMTQKERDFFNKKEYCRWIDDSWLLLGKALFYQNDWYGAEGAFEYIIKEFSNEPSRYEASIWISRTYTQLRKYNDALALLQTIDGEKDFPKKLRKDLATSFADVYINQKKYNDAIPWLEKAVKFSHKKKEKSRYTYILAQLYQQMNNFPKAASLYASVIKLGASYDMIFNAQINRATSVDQGVNTAQAKKQLNKMLRDDKNIDYQDQIYYALGKIHQKEKNEKDAIDCYQKSAKASMNNAQQKALSYLELGNIFYDKQKYLPAQNYYDSCLTFLDVQYPGYKELSDKARNLTDLADNLITILREDSLQKVAKMPERDRNKIIDKIIADIVAEEERLKQEEQLQQANSLMYMQNQQNQQTTQTAGKWYFYNPSSISYGMGEFKRKWGNRKVEDNWRRKNKMVVVTMTEEEELAVADSMKNPAMNKKSREYYLQNLPMTDSLMTVSQKMVEDAMFNAGEIYMNQFRNYNLSIESFEGLNNRFPKTDYQLISWYDLYRLNIFIENKERSDYYKQLIVQKHPNSNYANILSNPNYLKDLEAKQSQINELYEQAYMSFRRNRFNGVFTSFVKADSLMQNNPVMPKFTLLRALSYGGMGKLPEMKTDLRQVIDKYPGTDEKTQAETILALLEKNDYSYLASRTLPGENNSSVVTNNTTVVNKDTATVVPEVSPEEELFKPNDNEAHYFVVIYPHKVVSIDQLRFNLFTFNTEYFIMFDFDVQNTRIDDTFAMLTVKSFSGRKEANRYFKSMAKHKEILTRKTEEKHLKYFFVSETIYQELEKSKDYDTYIKFFEKKYQKKN